MKHLCIILTALTATLLPAQEDPAPDVETAAITDVVLRIRHPAGRVHTHREIVVGGRSLMTVAVEDFAGLYLFQEDENYYLSVIARTHLPAPPLPEPPPSEGGSPHPPPPEPEPPPAYELPPVFFAAEHTLPDGSVWYATGENANALQEVLGNLFDGDSRTKWLAWHSDPTIQLNAVVPVSFAAIRLTSANDAPTRDPAVLRLTIGETGEEIILDVPPFSTRRESVFLALPHAVTTSRLRIGILNRGDTRTQLAELELLTSEP